MVQCLQACPDARILGTAVACRLVRLEALADGRHHIHVDSTFLPVQRTRG